MFKIIIMKEIYWWDSDASENYWIEITDREDLGENLKAPMYNQSGEEFWSYSFLKLLKQNDIVLHYHKKYKKILGISQVEDIYSESQLKWAARGSFSRRFKTKPYWRKGWQVPLKNFRLLEKPIHLESIIKKQEIIKKEYNKLKLVHKTALYFPFELSEKRPSRPMQGYLFKFPKFMVKLFPNIISD